MTQSDLDTNNTLTHKKTALITGASGGIGSVIASYLSDSGYHLLLVDKNIDDTEKLASSLASTEVIHLDITDRPALDAFCNSIQNHHIELAFLNAGLIFTGTVIDLTTEQIDTQLDVNLRGSMLLNKACAKSMANHGGGHIINTVSLGAMVPLSNSATYCATKSALRAFLTAFSIEVAHQGVVISGIYPGSIDTPMLHYEAQTDCSRVAFMNKPLQPEAVLETFIKVQKTKKLENFVTLGDSFVAKLISAYPSLIKKFDPILEKMGQKGLDNFKKEMEKKDSNTNP